MDVPVWLFLLFALTQLVPNSESSHFRGGIITWKPNPDSLYKVDFNFRLAFRRSSEHCDNATISSQRVLGGGTWFGVSQGYSNSYNIGSAGYRCTEYSVQEDWLAGENSFNYIFPQAGPWVVRYTSCCWIYLVLKGYSKSWVISTTVDLTRRADTGQINSSPISTSSLTIRVQSGCSQNIRIPMEDPDGDVVRCRWAAGSSECGGICGGFPYASLEESSCTLKYDGKGVNGGYGVALMLEDFPRGTQDFSNPLSKVGLHFIVQITSSSGPCGGTPFFTGATPDDYACMDIAVGSYYSANLVAQHMDTSTEIVEISTDHVAGMSISSLYSYYDRYGQRLYSRNVMWTPSSSAIGQHHFCFKAVDKNGRESGQRCITLLVGSNNIPNVHLGTRSPTTPTVRRGSGHVEWSVHFDRLIKKPSHSKYIRIHLNNNEIYKIDTSSSGDVTISNNRTVLLFRTPFPVLSMRGSYYITMDTGAVVGMGCSRDGPPTPGFHSPGDWSFYIIGVCLHGFYLGPDLYSCVDVNECNNPQDHSEGGSTSSSSYLSSSSIQSSSTTYFSSSSASVYSGCPTSMSGFSGSFSSPNYPSSYHNYHRCTWRITVPSGYRVKVEFHSFNTEWSFDYLSIHNGPSSYSPHLGHISGQYSTCSFYSSGPSLWFEFYTDGSVTENGFYASYTAVTSSTSSGYISSSSSPYSIHCISMTSTSLSSASSSSSLSSSSIQSSSTSYFSSSSASVNSGCPSSTSGFSGSFSSPNYPNNYRSGQSCSWRITVPSGYRVKVEFTTLNLGNYYDYLHIYDGPSSYGSYLAYFWGNSYSSCSLYSSGTSLWFEFYSYWWGGGRRRFHATYAAVSSSSFSSYSYSSQCSWISSSTLSSSASSSSSLSSSSIQSSSTSYFSSSSASVNSGCPSSTSGFSGSFSSPNFPNNYRSGQSCFWRITVPSGYRVKVEFTTLNLGNYYDYLYIYDGPSSSSSFLIYIWGNYYSSCSLYSSGTSLWFKFYSYGWSGGRRRFHATYTAVSSSSFSSYSYSSQCSWISSSTLSSSASSSSFSSSSSIQTSSTSFSSSSSVTSGCPTSMSGFSGSFSSPNYPSNYHNSHRCTWRITVPSGYHVKVEFHSFNTEQGYDFLSIHDGPSSYSPQLGYISGQHSTCSFYSSGPSLWFEFYADRIITKKGFYASYTAVPSSTSSGYISSSSYSSYSIHCIRITSTSFSSVSSSSSSSSSSTQTSSTSFSSSSSSSSSSSVTSASSSSSSSLSSTQTSSTSFSFSSSVTSGSSSSIQPSTTSQSLAPTSTPVSVPFVLFLPANCDHSCVNTQGSFNCTCRHGYENSSPYGTCQDINECAVNNGGCSHNCRNTMGGYYCACLEGQMMSSDNRTCVEPRVTVECSQDQMQISLERNHLLHLNVLHLRHKDCQATRINDSHVTFVTLLNDCGTSHNESSEDIFFWNEVQADPVVVGGVVSRMHGISIPFYCVYKKKDLVSAVSYKPRRIVFAAEGGYGNMTFMMDLYQSASYSWPFGQGDYPVSVELNDILYVGYKVVSKEASLDVFAEKCWATPQPNPFTSPYYTFIEDGCSLDVSMSFDNFSSSSKRFTIKAFRFFQFFDGYSTVYLHCELMACHVHTLNSRCSRGCERSRRKRREADVSRDKPESESSRKYSLSTGPITIVKKPLKESADDGDTAESKALLIGGTAAASAIALVILIALAVLAVKYRYIRRLMNRNEIGGMYAAEEARKNAYVTEDDMGTGEKDETSC